MGLALLVAVAITLVTELLLNRRGDQLTIDPEAAADEAEHIDFSEGVSAVEKRGMTAAGIAPIVGCGFFVLGIVYGVVTRSITTFSDIPDMMVESVRPFAQVLVLFFAAAQFLAVFNSSSLGRILAIKGAEFFQSIDAPQFVILLGGLLLVALGAMLVTSGSGLWTLWGLVFFLWWALGIPWGPGSPISYSH